MFNECNNTEQDKTVASKSQCKSFYFGSQQAYTQPMIQWLCLVIFTDINVAGL